MTATRLTLAQARQSWLARQRLTADAIATKPRPLADLVSELGWIPLTSTVTPHLALFARGALAHRAELDDAAAKRGELSVVPGPRGSTWLVPTPEAPLARAFAVADHASREARIAALVTLTSRDLQGTRDAIRALLSSPASADEIRTKLPAECMRSLGEVGRKNGIPSLASLVLRNMWVTGEVTRVAADGRLDHAAGVRWVIEARPRTVPTAADAVDAIAARWLAAHAPMSAKAFATAFGIAAGRASAALKPLQAREVEIEGLDGPYLVPQDFAPAPPDAPAPAPRLLPLRDPLTDAQLPGLIGASVSRSGLTRPQGAAPAVLANCELIGVWQYDEVARLLTWRSLGPAAAPEVAQALDHEALRVSQFIQGELENSAPLHTPPAARPRPSAAGRDELSIEL